MRRPIGLIVIAVYCVLAGLVIVLQSVQIVVLQAAGLGFQLFGAVSFALGVFELIVAYGLFTMAPWGRVLAMVVFAAAIAVTTAMLLIAEGATPMWTAFRLFDIIIAAAIIGYLMRRRMRDLFASGAAATAPRP